MSIIINLTPPHVNHYPPYMTTFCQFRVLLLFSVLYQLTLILRVLQTVNTTLMVWSTVIITDNTTACKTSKSVYILGIGTTHYMCLFSAGIKPKVQKLKFWFSLLDMLEKHVCLVLVQKVLNRATACHNVNKATLCACNSIITSLGKRQLVSCNKQHSGTYLIVS